MCTTIGLLCTAGPDPPLARERRSGSEGVAPPGSNTGADVPTVCTERVDLC